MSSVENLSSLIASKISRIISAGEDQEEVIAYGLFVLIQTILSILLIALCGYFFNVLIEALVISFVAAILRKFSGGAHASSPISCAIIGMIIFVGLALIAKYMLIHSSFMNLVAIMTMAFIFAFIVIYKYSPVGTPTKPLKNENTRKRLKRKSLVFVQILLVINIMLVILYLRTKHTILLNLAFYISAGIAWQSITLVSLGHKIINRLDNVLRGTNS